MNDNTGYKIAILGLFVSTILLLYCCLAALEVTDNLKREAIELGHAKYYEKTGEWQWITNSNVINLEKK